MCLCPGEIEQKAEEAFRGDWQKCVAPLPESFTITMQFGRHQDAYFNSFYPGIRQLDDCTLEYTATDLYEVLRMVHFVLDK